jgi:hypothetical protein
MDNITGNGTITNLIQNQRQWIIESCWNDKLLGPGVWGLPGGWPLFCLFYGSLFVVFLVGGYILLKKANYK